MGNSKQREASHSLLAGADESLRAYRRHRHFLAIRCNGDDGVSCDVGGGREMRMRSSVLCGNGGQKGHRARHCECKQHRRCLVSLEGSTEIVLWRRTKYDLDNANGQKVLNCI